jgi:hypothetical protein
MPDCKPSFSYVASSLRMEVRAMAALTEPGNSDMLTDRDMGVLATAAGVITIGVLYAIDPAGTSAALLAMIGIVS